MTIVVTVAMIPVLYTAASEKSGYYIGRILWFGLIYIYSLVMNMVQVPWYNTYEEFICHGDITEPCLMECFEQLFSVPITGIWCYFYFFFIALFFLMEFLMAQIRHKHIKIQMKSMQERENTGEMEKGSLETIRKPSLSQEMSFLNFHQEKKLLYLYLAHSLLQVSIQVVLVCILTFKHLPIVNQDMLCSNSSCLAPFQCLIRHTSAKRVSIYGLITMSITIIFFGTSYFMYSIHHYLLAGHSTPKIRIY